MFKRYAQIFILTVSLIVSLIDSQMRHITWADLSDLLKYGTVKDVAEVFRRGCFSVNIVSESGLSVLMIALTENADAEIVKYLVSQGADVNAKYSEGLTVMMVAAYSRTDIETIDILLDAGADVGAKDDYGITALMIAERYNTNPEIIIRLKEAQDNPARCTRRDYHLMSLMPGSMLELWAHVYAAVMYVDSGLGCVK